MRLLVGVAVCWLELSAVFFGDALGGARGGLDIESSGFPDGDSSGVATRVDARRHGGCDDVSGAESVVGFRWG